LVGSLGYNADLGVAFAIGDDASARLVNERDCDIGSADWIIVVVDYVNYCWVSLKRDCFCRWTAC